MLLARREKERESQDDKKERRKQSEVYRAFLYVSITKKGSISTESNKVESWDAKQQTKMCLFSTLIHLLMDRSTVARPAERAAIKQSLMYLRPLLFARSLVLMTDSKERERKVINYCKKYTNLKSSL